MENAPTTSVDWPRVAVAGAVAFVLLAFWPGTSWNPLVIAIAAYWALPVEHRTRRNASIIGWSVGFVIAMLIAILS